MDFKLKRCSAIGTEFAGAYFLAAVRAGLDKLVSAFAAELSILSYGLAASGAKNLFDKLLTASHAEL